MKIDAQVTAMVSAYAGHFSDFDSEAICQFWGIPAVISARRNMTYFATYADLKSNVEALCQFYKGQGAKKADVSVVACVPVLTDCVHLSTRYHLSDDKGNGVTQWMHHYVLRRLSDDWRFVFAIADEEVFAWERRGTPIG